jgi:hypothetical protein
VVKVAVSLIALWFAAQGAAALAACRLHHGQHVVLYSSGDDPSVLVWDSRARLREYHVASFDEAQAMLPHAILVAPGTRAEVTDCIANYVESPIFHQPEDAIGVLITSGPQRGAARWVLGSDVRTIPRKNAQTPSGQIK